MKRETCPCCGYPTLEERAAYDICRLCNWEDDGQDDSSANKVWGGPNGDYSLTAARKNFKEHVIMYSDPIIILGQGIEKLALKEKLMHAFDALQWDKVKEYEAELDRNLAIETDNYSENIENNPMIFKMFESTKEEEKIEGLLKLQRELSVSQPIFVQDILIRFTEDNKAKLREKAIFCLGELIKSTDNYNRELIVYVVKRALKDHSKFVQAQAKEVLGYLSIES